MHELPHMSSVIKGISFTKSVVDFIDANREFIITEWVAYPAIEDIRDRLNYTVEDYIDKIASGALGYFLTVLRGENKPGDCPIMRTIVKEFYSLGLTVEDVFLNCTALKNVVLKLMTTLASQEIRQHQCDLIMVMDHNLYGVLSLYSEMMRSHEAELEFRNRIIQENVLYTRTDVDGVILEVTDAFCNMCGYDKDELIGNTHSLLKHPEVDTEVYRALWQTILSGEVWSGDLLNLHKDGTTFITTARIVPVFDREGQIIEFMAFRNDITASELAKVDPLTGLYNRREFDAIFQKTYLTSVANNRSFSVIVADIDHFKMINDTYGHQEGDDVIVRFAGILRNCIRNTDVCARWGGEEFIILLPDTELYTAYEVAERIRQGAMNCLHIGDHTVSCSFGVATLEKGEAIDDFFNRADRHLYSAKENGRNCTVAGI